MLFCSQVIHLFIQATLCYLVMHLLPSHSHGICFVVSMGYLAVMHLYRLIYDYGGYTLDITGYVLHIASVCRILSSIGVCMG